MSELVYHPDLAITEGLAALFAAEVFFCQVERPHALVSIVYNMQLTFSCLGIRNEADTYFVITLMRSICALTNAD